MTSNYPGSLLVSVYQGEWGRLRIPMEIRDGELNLLQRLPINEEHLLAPGRYLLSAALPTGQLWREVVEIVSNEKHKVSLGLPDEPDGGFTGYETKYEWWEPPINYSVHNDPPRSSEAAEPVRIRLVQEPSIDRGVVTRLRLRQEIHRAWSAVVGIDESAGYVQPLEFVRPFDNLDLQADSPRISGNLTTRSHLDVVAAAFGDIDRVFCEVESSDGRVAYVALPVAGHPAGSDNLCRITIGRTQAGLITHAWPGAPDIQLSMRYLQRGLSGYAGEVLDQRAEQNSAEGRFAVIARVYMLLRLGRHEELSDILERTDLPQPDSSIVRGEILARLGRHMEALRRFVLGWDSQGRTLPIFTDGYSIVMSRLRQYLGDYFPEVAEMHLLRSRLSRAEVLLNRLTSWLPYVDLSAPTFTLTIPNEMLAVED